MMIIHLLKTFLLLLLGFSGNKMLISVVIQKILRYTFDMAFIRDDFIQENISTYKRNNQV